MQKHTLILLFFLINLNNMYCINSLYAENQNGPYYIRSIIFDITGITKPVSLYNAAEIKEGEILADNETLESYVKIKTQLLKNSRVFEDVEIHYSFGDPEETGHIPVDLLIKTVDTWNVIALPYFKYDSSNGLEISAKIRDYNFLGTMQPLKIDLGYTIEREAIKTKEFDRSAFIIDIDSNYPFKAWDQNWNFDFDHFLSYTNKYGFEYNNTTGLRLTLPTHNTTIMLSAYQGIYVNEENADIYKIKYGERYQGYWYLSNWLRADWSIPTPFEFNDFEKILYIPSLQVKENYRPFGDIGEERVGPVGTIAQELFFGRVDWIDNFRKGLIVTLTNTNDYNFYKQTWNKSFQAEYIGHFPLLSFFAFSVRMLGAVYFDEADERGGLPIRGIIDSAINTNYGVYTNLDLPIQVLRFVPSEWFGKPWMRYFNFEQQWSPFIDMALIQDTLHKREFSVNNMIITSGIEIVTFPLFIRSFFLRMSLGFDVREAIRIKALPDGNFREIFIGLGHHY